MRSAVSKKQWDHLRGIVSGKAYNVCEICGGVGPKHPVECHEIWHYDDDKLVQKLVGMIALCPNCHGVKHFGFSRVQGKGEAALKHFMKINELKRKEAERAVTKSFEIWNLRSQKEWTLDISHLKEYGIDVSKLVSRK